MQVFNRRRVAIIVNSLLTHAGVERRTVELVDFLRSRGFEVEICALRTVGKVADHYRTIGVPVANCRVYEYVEGSGEYRFRLRPFVALWLHLLVRRFGVVFCVQPPSSVFGRFAMLPKLGRKVIAMERFLTSGRSPRRLAVDRFLARWATDRIVCVADLLRDEIRTEARIPDEKIVVIEDGVAIEPIHDQQNDLRSWIGDRFVFGFVGLLTERKRPRVLLDAFAGVWRTQRDSVLILVGSGEEEAELRSAAIHLGIADAVHFAGEQTHPHDFYRLFDVFVFPSVREGLGNVWIEAMLHQLPVLCANVRPMSDYIVDGRTGFLFPADDRAALRDTMLRLMANPALCRQVGNEAREFGGKHFDRDTQLAKLVALIRNGAA